METLLFVCTGNVCRSPMGAALSASLLAERGKDVGVASAGLLSPGRPATKEVLLAMRRRGLDLSEHRSGGLEAALEGPPDLILAMAREHARSVVEMRPDLFPRTFTLKDFVRRAREEKRRSAGQPMKEYLQTLQYGRQPWDLAGGKPDDDVPDPIGRPKRVYERCAAEIEELVREAVDRVWPVWATEPTARQ